MCACVSVCLCVCLCVCLSVRRLPYLKKRWSDSYQIWHVDCLIYENASHANYIDLGLHWTHTDPNHENDNSSIISETVQAMLIKFAVKIVRRRDGVAQLVRASDSRSKYPRLEPRQEHKKYLWEFIRVKHVMLTQCRCAQTLCVYARTRMITYAR